MASSRRQWWLVLLVLNQLLASRSSLCQDVCGSSPKKSPPHQQQVYRVGVLAIRGRVTALWDFNATFSTYLTETIGSGIYGNQISFEIVPIEFEDSDDTVGQFGPSNVDFVFANPSMFSCIESRFRASPLATFVNNRVVNGEAHALEEFGGVVFTRSDNDQVNTILDIKGRSLASVSISGLGSGQMQFREIQKAGMHYLQDPKQLLFMENQGNVIHGVLTGQTDVGLVRTDQLERYIDRRTKEPLDLSLIKIIQPQGPTYMTNGLLFPFPLSTSILYPEWPFAAMPHVDRQLVKEVQTSLLMMTEIGSTENVHECELSRNLSSLVKHAFSAGRFAGWSPPLSYLELRNLQRELGIITEGNQCIPSTSVKDVIVCKPGYYRRADDELTTQCQAEGIECHGFQCICSPCISQKPVEFAPAIEDDTRTEGSCSKFDVCGTVQQGDTIHYILTDNVRRDNATVHVRIFFGNKAKSIQLKMMDEKPYSYRFSFDASNQMVDVAILEISVDDNQIDLSPVRLDIVERDCVLHTKDRRKVADIVGNCVCDATSFDIGWSKCIPVGMGLLIIATPVLLAIAVLFRCYALKKRRETNFWIIEYDELVFPDEPRVLGRGSFGVVVEASYRGTHVAVKRVLPRSGKTSHSRFRTLLNLFHHAQPDDSGTDLPLTSSLSGEGNPEKSAAYLKSFMRLRRLQNNFQAEMKVMAKLRHPCITTLIGAVVDSAEYMLVLELMDLGSLHDLLHNETLVIENATILSILLDIVSSLLWLHSAQPVIVHKDLKSTNVLLDSKFRAKLSDFGFSQKMDWFDAKVVLGSRLYMAPELLQGLGSNSTASDVYAFGIVVTEILTRKSPYEGEADMEQTLQDVVNTSMNKRPFFPTNTPVPLARLIDDCLAAKPEDRPSAAAIDVRLKMLESEHEEFAISSAPPRAEGQSQALLYQIFPKHVADDLRTGKKPDPERFDMVTVFFSDIVGYTAIASKLEPERVSDLLDRLYTKLDHLCNHFGIFKVETIGDAYMTVTNLAQPQDDHAERMARFATMAIEAASETRIDESEPNLGNVTMRVGIHSGPVVAQVVGSRTPRYSVIGDTVNTASRFESSSRPGCIHCSEATASFLLRSNQQHMFTLVERGTVALKGKGDMMGFWVTCHREKQYCHAAKGLTNTTPDEPSRLAPKYFL